MTRSRSLFPRALAFVLLAAVVHVAHAQTVRGTVVDADQRAVPGVVVLLVDSAVQVAGRALSDDRGQFRLSTARSGTYRIRTLRIGYRPIVSEPIALAAGADVAKRIVLTGLPISLDTMRVVDRNVCRAFTDSGAATFEVWEQIRTALTAAQLTASARNITTTTVNYERGTGARPGINEGKVLRRSAEIHVDYATQPWRAISADSLRHAGYVVVAPDNSTEFYAPDIEVLLSPTFVEDHCFRLVRDRKHPAALGIAFAPVPDRRHVADINGTLWVDRASSELRGLEFRYVNAPHDPDDRAGAELQFVRLPDGAWAISRWEIRMPMLEEVKIPGAPPEMRVTEEQATGGRLALARRGGDTLWTGDRMTVSGTVVDSSSGDGIGGATVRLVGTNVTSTTNSRGRFTLTGVLPGNYDVEIHTPSLDSLNITRRSSVSLADADTPLRLSLPSAARLVASLCPASVNVATGGPPALDLSGIVIGHARLRAAGAADSSQTHLMRNLRIVAEWQDKAPGADTTARVVRRVEAQATADGSFRLCRLPVSTAVSIHAEADSAETVQPQEVRFAPGTRLARAELTLEPLSALAARGAVFTGVVVADSSHTPIVAAEVALPDIGKSTVTDAAGAFRIAGIPAGEQRVLVRRLGYGAADTKVTFHGNETVERRVVLGRAVMLEPVTVTERELERRLASFEENRHVGLGHFMTRAQIAKFDGMTMTSALSQFATMRLVTGATSGIWVTSTRVTPPPCPPPPQGAGCYENHGFYTGGGAPIACYSQVYLDGILMNGIKEPTEPFDLTTIAPERVEAMEYYAGPSETPAQYLRMGSNCGVLVIWTRRD